MGVKVTETKDTLVQTLDKLTDPMTQFDDVVHIITSDSELSEKTLKLLNSASGGLGREVNSLSLAVAMTGLTQIRNWAIYVQLSGVEDKPRELRELSLIRARCCQLLATSIYNRALSETAFTAGLLSTLDVFLDQPLEQLVHQLSFAEQVEAALIRQTGKIGKILQLILLHEQGRWKNMNWESPHDYLLTEAELNAVHASAVEWAQPILEAY